MAWIGFAKNQSNRRADWGSRRSIVAHVALAVWLPGCATACWWQVNIALSGDSIGWVYSVMWPCFAVFGAVFWWTLIHDDPETVGAKGLRRLQEAGGDQALDSAENTISSDELIDMAEAEDPELAAYNAYLAELARTRPKSWIRR